MADHQADLAEQRPPDQLAAPSDPRTRLHKAAIFAGSKEDSSFRTGISSKKIRLPAAFRPGAAPSESERRDLAFAWRVCAAVKSNAIVLARDGRVVGVGAARSSRLDSVPDRRREAGSRGRVRFSPPMHSSRFRDGPDRPRPPASRPSSSPVARAVDDETIRACDEHEIAMVLTGRRHFRH